MGTAKTVQGDVLRSFLQRRGRGVDGRNVALRILTPTRTPSQARRPHASQRRHGKPTCVAITIEHGFKAQTPGVIGKTAAAVALVQVEAGFVPVGDVYLQNPAMFFDL